MELMKLYDLADSYDELNYVMLCLEVFSLLFSQCFSGTVYHYCNYY